MNDKNEIPLFNVANITVGPIPRHGLVVIRPDFLTNLMQTPDQAQTGRSYALTPKQCHYLLQQIQTALDQLESCASPNGGGHRH